MGERTFMRVGAGALIVGTVLAFVFNLIHPRSSDALDSTRGELELVADSDIWLFDHMMLGVSAAFVLLGLVALATSMRGGNGDLWARSVLIAGVAGVVVIWITVVLDGPSNLTAAVLFPLASLSFTLVGFVLGVQMWRRSEAPAPTAAAAPPTPSPAGGA